jgi:hypothetical protein
LLCIQIRLVNLMRQGLQPLAHENQAENAQ